MQLSPELQQRFIPSGTPKHQPFSVGGFIFRMGTSLLVVIALIMLIAVWMSRAAPRPLLAFTSDRTGTNQIYVYDSSTGHLQQITDNLYSRSHAAWWTDKRLAFATYPAPVHLSIMDMAAWQAQPLLARIVQDEYEPDWSQDGQIAAATNQNINWDIVFYDLAGARHMAGFNSESNELEPCWWTDGSLSFVSDRDGSSDVYRYDFTNRDITNLTNHPAPDYNPACSTDGQLAFTSARDFNTEVYVMNLDTGETRNVTQNPAEDFNPAWLPDGHLSFVSDRDGNREIYVLDLTTGALTNITQNPAKDDQPAWSK